MIKAVFFDVGSTLIEPSPNVDGVFFEKARARGHDISLEALRPHLATINNFYEKEYERDGDFWCSPEGSVSMYLDMYRYLAHLVDLSDDAHAIAQDVHSAYLKASYWRIYEDVLYCLKTLKKQGFQLSVVSNWAPNLENLLCELKLRPFFDEIISSANVGYRKPDPMIFSLLLERLSLDPKEVIHVGDHIDADGLGAHRAGIKAVIIDRSNKYTQNEYPSISGLEELPSFIAQLG